VYYAETFHDEMSEGNAARPDPLFPSRRVDAESYAIIIFCAEEIREDDGRQCIVDKKGAREENDSVYLIRYHY
jgi:hypothetical protein